MKFRDKKTGRFVSRSTWKRSKAKGRTRYVRINRKLAGKPLTKPVRKLAKEKGVPPSTRNRKEKPAPKPEPRQVVTYFKYEPKDGRKKIDIRIVTDGPFNKKDLTNIVQITVKGKTYSGKDLEAFHALTWTAAHQRRD